MSNLYTKSEGKYSPVSLKAIGEVATLFIKDQKTMGKRCDEIIIAYTLHIVGQEHYLNGKKGDTSALCEFMAELYQWNKSFYNASVKWVKAATGFQVSAARVDEEDPDKGFVCKVTLDDKHGETAAKKFAGDIHKLIEESLVSGITINTTKYAKVTAPKQKSKKGKGENGDATEVPVGQKALEDAGIIAAATAAGDGADEEFLRLTKEMMELYSKSGLKTQAKDKMRAVIDMMRKDLKMDVLYTKKAPESVTKEADAA